jgi:signal transduction histidine kinase
VRTRSLHALDLVWAVFAVAMLGVMSLTTFGMTVPYHLIFVSFALVYGFRLWPAGTSVLILALVTAATGAVFLRAYARGDVNLDELSEIALMPAILGFTVWHGLRRVAAQRRVEELAALESSRLQRQREFLRDTSHAIRTPVTIARGHVELLRLTSDDPALRADTDEVLHQLKRLGELAGRLLVMETLDTTDGLQREPVDVAHLVASIGSRWRAAVDRRWVVSVPDEGVGFVDLDRNRLEEAVDAFVENAVRFTWPEAVVRLSTRRDGDQVTIEVADSGPGIPPADRVRVFDRFYHRHPPGTEPGTGLGLALVQSIARAHGGWANAAEAPEGGALLALHLPAAPAAEAASTSTVIPQQVRVPGAAVAP